MGLTEEQLDGFSRSRVFPDGTVIRVSLRRTESEAYPSGWKYTFHYGALDPETPGTLSDGTIRRYDNAHEDTEGHELHVAPETEPRTVEFTGVVDHWERFWSEVPRSPFDPGEGAESMTDTLVVTVESDEAFRTEVESAIETLAEGEPVDRAHTVSFPNDELLAQTLTASTLSLLRTVSKHEPGSIRETARLVERDVKNVHEELTRLEAMGIVRFEADGRAKRPVFPFDELLISVPFPDAAGEDEDSTATVT